MKCRPFSCPLPAEPQVRAEEGHEKGKGSAATRAFEGEAPPHPGILRSKIPSVYHT
jgi:hypothetical protein